MAVQLNASTRVSMDLAIESVSSDCAATPILVSFRELSMQFTQAIKNLSSVIKSGFSRPSISSLGRRSEGSLSGMCTGIRGGQKRIHTCPVTKLCVLDADVGVMFDRRGFFWLRATAGVNEFPSFMGHEPVSGALLAAGDEANVWRTSTAENSA